MNNILSEQLHSSDALASFALVTFLLVLWLLAGRALRGRGSLTPQVVRRWTANLRNLLLLVGLLGLILIWAPQLRTFALSLTAVAVALVIATKELILCLSGSAFRTFSRAYSIGDYVELGGVRGEVMDYNLLATRLQEFGDGDGSFVRTGRDVIVPHSLLFTSPCRVEEDVEGRVRHVFQLTFEPDFNLASEMAEMERAAHEAQANCETGQKLPSPEQKSRRTADVPAAQISVGTTDIGKYRLKVTVFAQAGLVQQTENAITCVLADKIHRRRTRGPAPLERHAPLPAEDES